jgi:hypothetical protein
METMPDARLFEVQQEMRINAIGMRMALLEPNQSQRIGHRLGLQTMRGR